MITDLIQNSALLITLTVLYGFLARKKNTESLSNKVMGGILFGCIAVAGMNMPFYYTPGVIYDGRSIVMALSGLFGGGITATISIVIAGVYRLLLGGAGIWAGTSTIVASALIGLAFRRFYKNRSESLNLPALYLMGLLVNVAMLLCQLLLPWPSGIQVISHIWMPVLLIFPVATALMGLLLINEKKRIVAEASIRKNEALYRTTLHSIGDAVVTTDRKGAVTFMNPVAEQLTGWAEKEAAGKAISDIFRIINEDSGEMVDCPVKKVLEEGVIVGLANHTLLISKQGDQIPIADSGAPIKDAAGTITGVVLVFRDQTEEREMQRMILKSEKSLKEAQEIARMGHWQFDLAANKAEWSENCFRMLGITPSETPPTFDFFRSRIYTQDLHLVDTAVEKMFAKKSAVKVNIRTVLPNGQIRWMLNKMVPEFRNGELIMIRGISVDITESKNMLAALKASEKGYKNLFENHAAVKLLIDPQTGDIVDANRAAKSFYGYTRKQLRRMNISEIIVSNNDTINGQAVSSKISKIISSEFAHRLADGSVRHVEVYTSKIEFKGEFYLHSIVYDITEKKKAESLIQLLSKSTDQSPVIIVITDPQGIIEYVNPKFTEITGYKQEEAVGKSPSILKSGKQDKAFYEELWNTINSGNDWKGEFLNKKKNGELYWESAVISSIIDEKGKIIHFVGTKEDITEKKKSLIELQLAKEKAEESDQLKSTFLANMSHEIRTPLNAILGFSNLLSTETDIDPKERREFVSIISQSSDNLLQIINDILDISKLETGQLKIFNKKFEAQPMLDELYLMFSKRLAETGQEHIRMDVEKPQSPVWLNTDKTRLIQVFMNLLSNAIKFTAKGQIRFGISEIAGEQVFFYVSDTGTGIKKEYLSSIFERFRQADDSSTRKYGGTGLGLSIVKNLVELMNGQIFLQSEEGEGTTVKFSLPVFEPGETNE